MALQAILLVRFHVWDCVQCPLELVSVEEFRAGLDVLMTCDAIREQSRHELLHRDVVPGGEFGSPFVQIFRYCDAFAHGLIPLLSSKTREVSSPACQTTPNRQSAVRWCVTMASAGPATASSRRNSSPGSGR